MIEAHVHLGQLVVEDPGLQPDQLFRWMDRHAIDRAVVIAVETPEEVDYLLTTPELLRLTKNHRDRLLPMCAVDPPHRYPGEFDPYPILARHVHQGCVGFGENL